jgi:superfamily II DNA/RNA helicase
MDPRKTAGHIYGGQELKKSPKSEPTGFAVFELRPELLRAAEKLGWTTLTPVQQKAIPPALAGHDLIALAQTGTGKTGAYLLPLLEAISAMPRAKPLTPYCVILAPTRELVQQIDTQVKALSQGLNVRSMTIFGGVSDRPQISQLMTGVELVTATPGRLLDLIGQRMVNFTQVAHCVLDEADRMFDMGFIQDLKRILNRMPTRRQTLLYSATMPQEIQRSCCARTMTACWSSPAPSTARTAWPAGFRAAAKRWRCSTATAARTSATRRWRASSRARPGCWWRPTWPAAAWTSSASG